MNGETKDNSSIQNLYIRLKNNYNEANLNRITAKIIELYRAKQHDLIKEIYNSTTNYLQATAEKGEKRQISGEGDWEMSKLFSRLVLIYHPDKTFAYTTAIEKHKANDDYENLNQLSHIFPTLTRIDGIAVPSPETSSWARRPEEENQNYYYYDNTNYENWDEYSYSEYGSCQSDDNFCNESEDFYNEDETDDDTAEEAVDQYETKRSYSFYDAMTAEVNGDSLTGLHASFLEDFTKLELVSYRIETLDGIDGCANIKILNLSCNRITDISELWSLKQLEELYLADNQIGDIDTLCNMRNLRILDLANNNISDISDILELENLEFVNLFNNPVPKEQVKKLNDRKVIVLH